MAEITPTAAADIVMIDGTYGTPRIFNGIYDHTTDITYNVDDLAETATVSMNSVDRVLFTYTYNVDDTIATVNTKFYDTDGITVLYETLETYTYTSELLTKIECVEV